MNFCQKNKIYPLRTSLKFFSSNKILQISNDLPQENHFKEKKKQTNKTTNQANQTLENLIEKKSRARKEERFASYKTISKINYLLFKTIIEECKRKRNNFVFKKIIARTCTIKPQEAWHFALNLKVEIVQRIVGFHK